MLEIICNKIFGMDNATRRRMVEAILTYVFMVFATLHIPVPGDTWQEIIVKGLLILLEAFEIFYEQHYKNNDHTEIAAKHTGEMRQEKLEQDSDYVGERFYTEEPEEGVDLDDDEVFDEIMEESEPIEEGVEINE